MFRRFAYFGVMALVLTAIGFTAANAEACCTAGVTATCHGGSVLVEWNMACEMGTQITSTDLYRKCGDGKYVLIASEPTSPYADPLTAPCMIGKYTYKLVVVTICNGHSQFEEFVSNTVTCP